MATCCSILAWKIPWTVEPGRLASMGHKDSNMNMIERRSTRMHGVSPVPNNERHSHRHYLTDCSGGDPRV